MAIEFNPKPAGDYKTLLQQFNSLVRLHNANVNCLSLTRAEVSVLMNHLSKISPAEVDSQRDANSELTTLLEQQEVKLSSKDKELTRLRNALAQSNRERDALREEVLGKTGPAYRAAADIYYQLVQEYEIPEGGSLVGFIEKLFEEAHKTVTAFREYGSLAQGVAIDQLAIALDASNQERNSNAETM